MNGGALTATPERSLSLTLARTARLGTRCLTDSVKRLEEYKMTENLRLDRWVGSIVGEVIVGKVNRYY